MSWSMSMNKSEALNLGGFGTRDAFAHELVERQYALMVADLQLCAVAPVR